MKKLTIGLMATFIVASFAVTGFASELQTKANNNDQETTQLHHGGGGYHDGYRHGGGHY